MREGASAAATSFLLSLAAGLGVGYAVTFAWMCGTHVWLFDAAGHSPVMDFTVFWSAGKLALRGNALAVYDAQLQHAAEVATVGHPFGMMLGWFYPPLFLFVAVGLAWFSQSTAFVIWTSAGVVLHAANVAAIVRRWQAFFIATAATWAMLCNTIGQDGLFTAAIMGMVLSTLERRQILSGVLLGLLSYKPQFGVLFPIVFAFGGYWRAFLSAAASVVLLTLLSAAIFGFGTLPAFVHGLSSANATILTTNKIGIWFSLQSVYGVARCLGASYHFAMMLQLGFSASCVMGLAWLWRSRVVSYSLKAAALCISAYLVMPYVSVYDLPVLSMALAFLYLEDPFDLTDWCCVVATMALAASHPFIRTLAILGGSYPAGLLAAVLIGLIVLRRLARAQSSPLDADGNSAQLTHYEAIMPLSGPGRAAIGSV